MTNREIAAVLDKIADILQVKGEDYYKIRAYRSAANSVYRLDEDIKNLYKANRISDIPAVGKAIKAKIEELLEKGSCEYLDKLLLEVPPGVLEMLRIPGIGHKTVKTIFEETGIDNLDDLLKAAQEKRIRVLPGCGKSTFLRTLNRLNELIEGTVIKGQIYLDDIPIYEKDVDVVALRKKVGMVFQKPSVFPLSIYENVAYGPKIHGIKNKRQLDSIVEKSLQAANLWKEVSDRLNSPASRLSGGQQQRLVIARVLAVEPEVILMDEPASALDPISTSKLEELIAELKNKYTIAIVTHNMQQAARVSDYTAFFLNGEMIEFNRTDELFVNPRDKRTEDYITGRFG